MFQKKYREVFRIEDKKRILEIGCGPGALAESLARWYPKARVFGVVNRFRVRNVGVDDELTVTTDGLAIDGSFSCQALNERDVDFTGIPMFSAAPISDFLLRDRKKLRFSISTLGFIFLLRAQ